MISERDFLNQVLTALHYGIAPQVAQITPRANKAQQATYDDVILKMNALYTVILSRVKELPDNVQENTP